MEEGRPETIDLDMAPGGGYNRPGAEPAPPASPHPAATVHPFSHRGSRLRRALLALVAILSSGAAPSWAQETGSYGVRPGDQVTTDFFTAAGDRLAVIAGTRTVDRDGNLFLPYVGSVNVTGLDASAIRQKLEALYSGFYTDPVVDVTVQLRVNVTGTVRLPGNYYVSPSSTVIDVISLAGGVQAEMGFGGVEGDPTQVRLVREGSAMVLDVRPDVADRDVLEMRIQSGDWIFVPPRGQSRMRQEVQFWGSVVSLLGSIVAIGFLIAR